MRHESCFSWLAHGPDTLQDTLGSHMKTVVYVGSCQALALGTIHAKPWLWAVDILTLMCVVERFPLGLKDNRLCLWLVPLFVPLSGFS